MGVELELKFEPYLKDRELLAALLPEDHRTISMETTYFDTPAGEVTRRRWTLRLRRENEKTICTLKTPAKGPGRQEYEVEAPSLEEGIPQLLAQGAPEELAALTGFVPVCGAKFTRRCALVREGQSVVELAVDQGELLGGSRRAPLLEVEAELKQGSQEDLMRYGSELCKKAFLVPQPRSKFQRAYGLYQEEQHGTV